MSYGVRLARAFATLFVFAVPLLTMALFAGRRNVSRALIVTIALVLGGSALAAADVRNERHLNPLFYGGPFVAATLPAALAAAVPAADPRKRSMVAMAAMIAVPLALLLSGVAWTLAYWAYEHGIPATW